MSIIGELSSTNQIAMAVAAALEQALDGDIVLAVGRPRTAAPTPDVLPPAPCRTATTAIVSGASGGVHVVLGSDLADRLVEHAGDEPLLRALAPVFERVTTAMATVDGMPLGFAPADEIDEPTFAAHVAAADEFLVYSLLDGNDRVGALVVAIGAEGAGAPAGAAHGNPNDVLHGIADAGDEHTAGDGSDGVPAAPATVTPAAPGRTTPAPVAASPVAPAPEHVVRHEFTPLHDGGIAIGNARSLTLLQEVEMGVTAELGRRRMTVRDLLSLTPGAVIELDRPAGSPVDVLVNGTLIARGEVVVIDEEFGIRISEIVNPADAAA